MSMYNKLFTKILDSSIWLESDSTRIVWLTLLAAMDEDGFAQFASVANLSHRARVSVDACQEAIRCLEGEDLNSADPENGGRRLERVNGGWMVLNAEKYRLMVTRVVARERTRERVKRFRERVSNAPVTVANDPVTPSEAVSESYQKQKQQRTAAAPLITSPMAYERRKAQCAYVGARLEIPNALHGDMRKLLGGTNTDTDLFAWYADLDQEIEASGEAITPDVFRWIKARFATWKHASGERTAEQIIASLDARDAKRKAVQ